VTPRQRYQADLQRPGFSRDAAQQRALDRLQDLHDRVTAQVPKPPWWKRAVLSQPPPIRGLYLWGGPGRGKTYLMDCFFESLPIQSKRRVHFHRFMLEIHEALRVLPRAPDPLPIVAERLSQRCRILCLDEFHVSDIADAMLLAGLLEALFERGVTLVATSNTCPGQLYRDGLQRDRFVPAIDLLQRHTEVHCLEGKRDFRLELLQEGGTYRVASGPANAQWLLDRLHELAAVPPKWGTELRFMSRTLDAKAVADDVVWFEFDELCVKPRSARDYLELAREFHTVLIESVPRFDAEREEAALRFIHLIDTLYDHAVKCIVLAEARPEHLCEEGRLSTAFQRTASRLVEMSSAGYLARPHRPH
jgi:cell division protein ZapE